MARIILCFFLVLIQKLLQNDNTVWVLAFNNTTEANDTEDLYGNCAVPHHHLDLRPAWVKSMIPKEYDSRLPPIKNGCPAIVEVKIQPWAIALIEIEEMVLHVDVYVGLFWHDHRLKFPSNMSQRVAISQEEALKLWTPIAGFRNAIHSTPIAFDPEVFHRLRISKGRLYYFVRRTEKFFCNFDISSYPMDTQVCYVEVQTVADEKPSVVLLDDSSFFGLMSHTDPPQFKVTKFETGNCSRKDNMARYMSCVEFKFTMQRQMAYYLMLAYSPSLLIVILSWISFWLDVEVPAPRVALGLTSLLTLATQFANLQARLPPVSYVKALDVWMFVCIFMVFGSLIEFAVSNYITRWRKTRTTSPEQSPAKVVEEKPEKVPTAKPAAPPPKPLQNKIDRTARWVFPTVFTIFNIIYWTYYLTIKRVPK